MAITLEPMTIADFEEALAFWKSQPGVGLSASDAREQIAQFLERNPGLSLVARDGKRLVGTALCGHDGRRGCLYHVAVRLEYRRGGLGRRLVEECVEKLEKAAIQKCNIVVLGDNPRASDFWVSLGYVRRGDLIFMQRNVGGDV